MQFNRISGFVDTQKYGATKTLTMLHQASRQASRQQKKGREARNAEESAEIN